MLIDMLMNSPVKLRSHPLLAVDVTGGNGCGSARRVTLAEFQEIVASLISKSNISVNVFANG